MEIRITTDDYIQYLKNFYEILTQNKDYVTELDLATGDGDHWTNMNMGIEKILGQEESLVGLSLQELFKKIGMTMMSTIGGSSGILYGGAYVAASKALEGTEFIDAKTLGIVWETMLEDMKKRGKSEPGSKTMLDALAPAVETIKSKLDANATDEEILHSVIKATNEGAMSTKDMPALRGRASYQANKGVGHLDPGAVTMAYQIETLAKLLLNKTEKQV